MNSITETNEEEAMSTDESEVSESAIPELTGEESMEELLNIYDKSLKQFEEGQVIIGTVISVGRDQVLVDVGYKSEGQIPIHEFMDDEGKLNVQIDDQFEVMIEVWDEEEETVLLSREKAKKVKVWDSIKEIYDRWNN